MSAAANTGRLARLVFPLAAAKRIVAGDRRGTHYDALIIHEPSAMAYLMARKWNATLPPCVVMSHGVEQRCWDLGAEKTPRSLKTRIVHPLTELAQANYSLRHADAVICLSSDDVEYVHRTLGVPAERIHRMSNGVDPDLFRVERKPSPQSNLLFMGSWILRKGTHEFVQAFAELRAARPGLRCVVIGSGVPAEEVRREFAPADRGAVEVFPSVLREELPQLLASDLVYVLPSHFEGMPLTLLEAMAAGLPCVTTNICGMRDVIVDGRDGFLVKPGDVAGLVAALGSLLASDALRRSVGNAARQTARGQSWEQVAGDWEKVLVEVADQKPRRFVLQEGRWSDELTENPGGRLAGVLVKLSEELRRDAEPFREMEQWKDLQIAGRILDLGCGTGWKAAALERNPENTVVAMDRDARLLEFGRQTFGAKRLVQADGCALAFPSSFFDWALAIEVIEHLPRPDLFLREVCRVLRPGGRLLLTTPNRLQYLRPWRPKWFYLGLRRRIILEPSHVREFNAHEFEQLLPPGLSMERLRFRGTLCGRPMRIDIRSVPQPFRSWWAQGIEVVARKEAHGF
jgi:glycosyltransferase involved in cell wall biosynthesis/SAM-dependent methyltransferase